ncbi:MAG: GHMP kinase [Bryobacterales bacterium]|nr:GHMP kinase [Bryobacterales bacterium]
MIETYAYARAGLLGNPSDGYFGKTIAVTVGNFRARVLVHPSARLEIRPSKADMPVFESLEDLYATTRWRGYYGGIRIIQALIVRLIDWCAAEGIELENRNFTLEYESTIPLRLGLGGSSAIIIAALRALIEYYQLEIPLQIQARLALETETRELGVPAGPQDRVAQVYEGLVYMDFRRELMESRGFGEYEYLDTALLPDLYLAYRTKLSEGTEVFHNNVRERWKNGDARIISAMEQWASYAEQGKTALTDRNYGKLGMLIDANYDLREQVYRIGEGNREMVRVARSAGATANFAGSGGAIVGTYDGAAMLERLRTVLRPLDIVVVRPALSPLRVSR